MSEHSKHGLEKQGFEGLGKVHWNLSAAALYEHALRRGEAEISEHGALLAHTTPHTGRSPKDKFVIEEASSKDDIWWGPVNAPLAPEKFEAVRNDLFESLKGKEVFVQDCYCGADPEHRLRVRIITEFAWHNLFGQNMFIQPPRGELADFVPDFTVVDAPGFQADPAKHGTRSETCILLSFEQKMVLVGGTRYAGEIKKGIFSVMNHLLPARGVLPMHCSANVGDRGDVAVFFGLSGTGKTTLSADPQRALIGDDEHGWSDSGVFNLEGGCYAKVINLSAEGEPEIFATTRRFGTIVENVVMDEATRALDFTDASITENTRCSYPTDFIPGIVEAGRVDKAPRNVVFLTCDAFGVLPPISRLTPEQAMYHFLSGYTAKVAGTECGVTEPQATFSACFGSPFLTRPPTVYAKMLGERIKQSGAKCWLVNTGWTGGGHGVGTRMKLSHTRAMLNAALHGELNDVAVEAHPIFGVGVPVECPNVPTDILHPKRTWSDPEAYEAQAKKLAAMFQKNFEQFADAATPEILAAAPKA